MQGREHVKLQATWKPTPYVADWYRCACEISGFHHDVDEIRDLLGYYAAYGGNYVPVFRNNQEDLDF